MDQLVTHLKKLGETLTPKQMAGLAAAFLAVVTVVVGSAYFLSIPTFTLLVTDMDAETASAVISQLESDDVPYRLTDAGRSVSVPVERADQLRLQFASSGLVSAGRVGYDIFDRPTFGSTDFLEQLNLRRALEGELARTIETLAQVRQARVHIAKPRDSLFLDREKPATASVVLGLYRRGVLPQETVEGIASLVAHSVEGLLPEAVTILDMDGRPLTRNVGDSAAAVTAQQFERQQQIERDLTQRVVALLEPVVGPGRVRVDISAELNGDMVEATTEQFDPASLVPRSSQVVTDGSAASLPVGGVAGARANLPPAANGPDTASADLDAAAGEAASTSTSTRPAPAGRYSETVNYEINKTTTHTVTPQGQLSRLSVAVILDDERVTTTDADGNETPSTRPWEADGLQRISNIVSAAVGLDPTRGDQLIVENIAFEAPAVEPEPAPPGIGTQVLEGLKRYGPGVLRTVGILAVSLYALFGIVRPLARRAVASLPAAAPALPAPTARLPTVGQMEGEMEERAPFVGAGPTSRVPALSQQVAKLATDEPEQLAGIVRGWIAEADR